ncbi:DUF4231 domain-containing protein [Mucilaginibacter sp.]|jgi:hypothetical protein|uniref:DUF4231 domain-containing protein n=1 Tax=Mucilaginibacter sp. TaxID=1882438 RepID=UPI00374DCEBA
MDQITFDKYVEDRYIKQMDYYQQASAKNQKKYKQFQWVLIILSALTPVIAALNGVKSGAINIYPLINVNILVVTVSSIVAILTTGLKTFNYQELWIKYRSTYEKLKPEIYYYNFNIGPYAANDVDRESVFVTRIEAILDTEHTQWPPAKSIPNTQDKSVDPPISKK